MKHKRSILLFIFVLASLAWNAPASIGQEIESLINQLDNEDEDDSVRHNASKRLAQNGAPAVPELVSVLPEADLELALSIVETLTLMGSDAESAVSALIEALRKPNFSVYRRKMFVDFHDSCVEALVEIGTPAVPALKDVLSDANAELRYHAARTLSNMGYKANPAAIALVPLLNDEYDKVRIAAASALGGMRSQPVPDIVINIKKQALERSIQTDDAMLDRAAETAIPDLMKMIGDESNSIRAAAVRALGTLGGAAAVPALTVALKDRDDNVRTIAAITLGEIGFPANAAVPTLINKLKKGLYETEGIRVSVVQGLGGIGTPAAVSGLIEALNDPSGFVRRMSITELARIGEPVDDIILLLMKTLADTDADVRVEGSQALGRIGVPAVPALTEGLSHETLEVRIWSANALSQIEGDIQVAEPVLIQALRDKDKDVRRYAAYALKKIGTPEAIKAAIPVLEKDDEPIMSTHEKSN
ncbi:MAG: HEAT repeat domain-containing protein [Candidatus Poribacteria bacterium]|nr:HEAT repeat domain-containing protein [Candidatus Poribacteria bacterium]